jgi:hypothetical protein
MLTDEKLYIITHALLVCCVVCGRQIVAMSTSWYNIFLKIIIIFIFLFFLIYFHFHF